MAELRTLTSERAALEAFLDAQRERLIRKLDGLDDAAARRTPTVSSLSLLGLVKHSAIWEGRWFETVMAGRVLADGWPDDPATHNDDDLVVDESDTIEHWVARYRDQVERSRAVVASMDLDAPSARPEDTECNLRYVLLHLIEETARHAGHADLIRETIDGARGI